MYAKPLVFIQRQKNDAQTLADVPTHLPPAENYVSGALLVSIGGPLRNMVSIAAMFAVPQNGILNVVGLEPVEPQWVRYQADSRITLASAVGVRPLEFLAVGIGIQTFSNFSGSNAFNDVTATSSMPNGQLTHRDIEFKLDAVNAVIAGITVLPSPKWRIGVAYRESIGLTVNYPDNVNVVDLGQLNVAATGTMLYSPHQISAGVQWAPSPTSWLALDLNYELWSLAPEPVFAVAVTTTGALSNFNIGAATVQPAIAFHDTLTPTVNGGCVLFDHLLTLRVAYSYRPTYLPVTGNSLFGTGQPVLQGGANYLDTSAHIVGVGASVLLHDPIHLFPYGINIDVALQTQILPRSEVTRDNTSDPVGTIAWGGATIAAGAGLRMEL
jgi:hypothetical protein